MLAKSALREGRGTEKCFHPAIAAAGSACDSSSAKKCAPRCGVQTRLVLYHLSGFIWKRVTFPLIEHEHLVV